MTYHCSRMGQRLTDILNLFRHQAKHNEVYRTFLNAISRSPTSVSTSQEIPFLPIDLFKSHVIKTGHWTSEHLFKSSGTTASRRSTHHVKSVSDYKTHSESIFESIYGQVEDLVILALLPNYAPDSSLVTMVSHLINRSSYSQSGFINDENDFAELNSILNVCKNKTLPTILFGVTYSLLNFAAQCNMTFPELIVIETGGMKGRGKELTRSEIHDEIKRAVGVKTVHSEYGMTELLSQSYSARNGIFYPNAYLSVHPGDMYDPLASGECNQTARLNIIDLANRDSCAFIATSDIGRVFEDGSFEVLGRLDYADIRGCNLLMSS